VSTYPAVSGAGIAPLDAFLAAAKNGYQEPNRLGASFSPTSYAGNTVPHNSGTDDSGFSAEERKLMFESRKILALPKLDISAQCCRVAVAVGHYENVWVTFSRAVNLDGVAAVLADATRATFLRYVEGAAGEGLSALGAARDRDRALVGRLRRDPRDPQKRSICLTVVADNLRLGAATNAVRIASRWFPSSDPALQTPG
jgi:aspartate-semialdehyde dehydrogenase